MSRITGTDAFNLMEAYNSIYAPQELTEEQVWEEVEVWVNSLVEEGYDLSEYTWEDMYEAYIDEQDRIGDFFTKPIGYRGRTELRNRAPVQSTAKPAPSQANRPAGGGMGGLRGSGRDRTSYQTSSSPGALRVPANAPYQSRFAGARDAAFARARQIQGSPVVGPRAAAPAAQAPARPVAQAPARPAAAPTGGVAKPTTTAPATTPVTAPAAPARPSLRSDIVDLQKMRLASQERQRKGGATVVGSQMASFDMFDVVQGYLIDEGYAENEEAAAVIMANMSEEWRESIIEAKYGTKKGRHELAMKTSKGEDIGKKNVKGETGFKEVEKKAKKYGATDPSAVAAAAMWKKYGK